jgi:hypothetical protein
VYVYISDLCIVIDERGAWMAKDGYIMHIVDKMKHHVLGKNKRKISKPFFCENITNIMQIIQSLLQKPIFHFECNDVSP